MSYCVKHAENFHTQTCRRCDDESAIAAKDAEIAALRQEIATGRGQYHRDYAAECDSLLAAKDKVIADLREQRDNAQIAVAMKQDEIVGLSDEVQRLEAKCGRLVAEINAWRSAWRRCDIVAHSDVRKAIDSTISASLNRINGAQLAVDTNNDLSERETNDG